MKIKDDPKIKALEWHLKFLSEDLENMNELDFRKLVVDAEFYFMNPMKGLLAYYILAESMPPPMPTTTLKKIGKKTKDLEANAAVQVMERVDSHGPTLWDPWGPRNYPSHAGLGRNYPWRENLRVVQAKIRNFMKEISEGTDFKSYAKADVLFGRGSGKFKVIYDPVEPSFADATDPSKLVEEARLSLIFALDGIPDEGAIKTCRECGRYFLHLSKKPKFFCDYKCTVKFTSRKRREKDPDGYRAAQREIMRKKYRERQAEKRGVPVEKVKIQKRRRRDGR
jgi:hypothetical protein